MAADASVLEPPTAAARAWTDNRRFREFAARNPEARSPASFERVFRDNAHCQSIALQPWPLFVEGSEAERLGALALGMDRLMKSIPERFFANDAARMATGYQLEHQREFI